jgi:hypothetical protein
MSEQTSKAIAAIAAKLLRNPSTPKDVKRIAGSVLTQAPNRRRRK